MYICNEARISHRNALFTAVRRLLGRLWRMAGLYITEPRQDTEEAIEERLGAVCKQFLSPTGAQEMFISVHPFVLS